MRTVVLAGCVLAVSLLLAQGACADIIHLTNGGSLEGIVTDNGDSYQIRTTGGMCTVAKSQVKLIEKSETVIEKYEKAAKDVRDDDIEGRFKLAMLCKEGKWTAKMREELGRVLKLDPSHEQAHTELGHELVDGKWMTRDEAMAAKGYVKFESKWVPKEYMIQVEQWKAEVKSVKALEKKINESLKLMGSRKKSVRENGLKEFVPLSRQAGIDNGEEVGRSLVDYYERAWEVYAEVEERRVTAEIRARSGQIAGLPNVPGVTTDVVVRPFIRSVRIETPQLNLIEVETTAIIPAGTRITLGVPPRPQLAD
jgi:hypothetical protein